MKLFDAFKAFWHVLTGKDVFTQQVDRPVQAEEMPEDTVTMKEKAGQPEKPVQDVRIKEKEVFENGAVFTFVLLQRQGRLIDFLQENIDAFDDSQVGAAVRQIHSNCRKVLSENFILKPVFDTPEGESCEVAEDFDPAEIKMTGNVPENPPYKGILQHKGWLIDTIKLPQRSGKINPKVVYPAEVSF